MNVKKSFSLMSTVLFVSIFFHQAYADENRWLVRGAVTNVNPTSSPGSIFNNTAKVNIDDTFGVTGTISYFFTPNIAADLLVGLPPEHDIIVAGNKAATTKHLPPILSLQYHFSPNSKISPYVGAGVNYTYFLDEKLKDGGKLKLSSSVGLAAQVGVDIRVNPQWTVGADIRYADIDTDVKINNVNVGNVDVNPTIYSLNVGYRF
ncbi:MULTISPECIES: OmpW/AlkL family protein [Acinetobacter calcoaceticus/baumannii complex]|uniref:OmpW/AlkL family protein n=1 Tax=Acinetobacter calcoaceticus/baumannii complex TaxID=909768 RepID=UPI0023805A27|nr:OmpW family outer membrane protein [Acinetobacter pittii]MDE4040171.1 outer membrane beta-barrel protein [Acinetobacter pittii]